MPGDLRAENDALRRRLADAESDTAQTLLRATRLSQVISILGHEGDLATMLERAAAELAELFRADIGLLLLGPDSDLELAGQTGLGAGSLPEGPVALPADDTKLPAWLEPYGLRDVARVRLAVGAENLGVLLLGRMTDQPFEASDFNELEAIAYRIALSIQNHRLRSDMERQIARLRRLHKLSTRLTAAVDLGDVASTLAATVIEEMPTAGVGVYIHDAGDLRLVGGAGEYPGGLPERLLADHGLTLHRLQGGDTPIGAVLLSPSPEPGSELEMLLTNVLDVAGLAVQKAVLYEQTRDQARRDSLTGLLGHRAFHEALEEAITGDDPGRRFSLAMMDIDDFKQVNDTYGHPVGDEALSRVSSNVRRILRDSDTVFRVGGEEFCVLIPGDAEAGRRVAERLLVAARTEVCGAPVTVSVGLACWPAQGPDRDSLIRQADAALYESKAAGKNRLTAASVTDPALRRPSRSRAPEGR